MSGKKILIISYTLPPQSGIGGRRWAKFGRLLLERGYDVKFLSERPSSAPSDRWKNDLVVIGPHITYFDSAYPTVLQSEPYGILEKLAYRLALTRLKRQEEGNYFDRSCRDEEVLTGHLETFLDKGYTTVISTGAPFIQLYHLAKFRAKDERMKLLVDLRDPWTKQDWSYGFQSMDSSRRRVEEERESFVARHADHLITVADRMTKDMQAHDPNADRSHTIYNGYDPKEIGDHGQHTDPRLRFVYTGNLYDGALPQLRSLMEGLDRLESERPDVYVRLAFDFYGDVPGEFAELTARHKTVVHHGRVDVHKAQEAIAHSDIALLFLIDGLNYSLSTKFFDYIALDKKILLFAKEGETSRFITEQRIGWHYRPDEFASLIDALIAKKNAGDSQTLPTSFDKQRFSIERLCDDLEELF